MKNPLFTLFPSVALLAAALAPSAVDAAIPDAVPYQGRIAASGTAFTGTGYFKFAVYQQMPGNPGSATLLWTNSAGATTTALAEPASAASLPVTNGLFAIGLGGTGIANMATLPSSLAPATGQRAFVRVWFSQSGNAGTFQALSPDTELHSVPFAREAANTASIGGVSLANIPQLNAVNTFTNVSGLIVQGDGPIWGTYSQIPPSETVVPTGAGSRMAFIPGYAAFRAGFVNGDHWEATKIGLFSSATGYNTTASGNYSTASGYHSIASGVMATASGDRTTASGASSYATGQTTQARGRASMAMGYKSQAIGDACIAMGEATTADYLASTAMGYSTIAKGMYSTSMGEQTLASGMASTAMGARSVASAMVSTAMGSETIASGNMSTAMGEGSTASGTRSTAMGAATTASGGYATAMGEGSVAPSYAETAVGSYNTNYTPSSIINWSAGDRAFVVGNGTPGARSDAFIINKRGDAWLAGTLLQASDRTKKTDIVAVDTATILAGVASLPIATWRYKNDTATHLGPMAQDFASAFHLAGTDTSIASVDADGVALAAIQELKKQLDAVKADNTSKDKAIAALAADNAALHKELAALKQSLAARLAALEAKLGR
jgi:hypothetical protein